MKHTRGTHVVQFFDTTTSLVDTITAYVADGLSRGEQVVVVAQPAHSRALGRRLASTGVPSAAAVQNGDLIVLDAVRLLHTLLVGGVPDAARFEATVGSLVRRLTASGRAVRIYGEMVDVLAAEDDLTEARQLEELWNRLADSETFALFCGYSALHFGNSRSAAALRDICACHSDVQTNAADELATWLVDSIRTAHA